MFGFNSARGIVRGQQEAILEQLRSEDANSNSSNSNANYSRNRRPRHGVRIRIPLWVFLVPIVLAGITILYIIMSINVEAENLVTLYTEVESYSIDNFDSKSNFNRPVKYLVTNSDGSVEIVVELSEDYIAKYKDEIDDSGSLGDAGSIDSPSDAPVGSIGPTGQEAADAIIKALQDKGYNDYAIAAAIGNFYGESGCNPLVTQSHTHDGASNEECVQRGCTGNGNGNAHGFAQWDGGRRAGLILGAMQSGIQWYDFDYQLGYFMAELNSNNCSVEKFNEHATDVEHAVFWFVHKFERCGISSSCPGYNSATKFCASQVSYDERHYINSWQERLNGAKEVLGQ